MAIVSKSAKIYAFEQKIGIILYLSPMMTAIVFYQNYIYIYIYSPEFLLQARSCVDAIHDSWVNTLLNNHRITLFLLLWQVPSAAKYPLPPMVQDFAKRIFASSRASKNFASEASKRCFLKICHLWGKRYFAAIGTRCSAGSCISDTLELIKHIEFLLYSSNLFTA